MKLQEKYIALKECVHEYAKEYLKEESYLIDAKRKSVVYILDKEESIIAVGKILPCEIAIIPRGIYIGKYPLKVSKIKS